MRPGRTLVLFYIADSGSICESDLLGVLRLNCIGFVALFREASRKDVEYSHAD